MKVIKVIDFANGLPCPIAGQYLKTFDFEAGDGVGYGEFTKDIHQARKFEDQVAVWYFWKRQSAVNPTRPDGQPNRPFTCCSIEIVEAPPTP